MRQTIAFSLLPLAFTLLMGPSVFGVEEEILLGGEDEWRDMALMQNTRTVEGYRGQADIVLSTDGLEPTEESELFLPFDQPPVYDRAGSYRVVGDSRPEVTSLARFGGGAARFGSSGGELTLAPASTRLFAPGSMLGDFTLDFWLYPSVIDDGQRIFRWEGSRWEGSRPVPQLFEVTTSDSSLEWRVENLFVDPEGETSTIRLRGERPLIPRRWSHHQLSYDAGTGLFEYTVNGVPEAVAYATTTGGEPGQLLYGRVGEHGSGEIVLGEGLQAVLDEFRISRRRDPEVLRTSLTGEPGEVISRPFDLGLRGSKLSAVEAVTETPEGTEVQLFYRIGDELSSSMPERAIDAPWTIVPEGDAFPEARGRYLQLRALLLSGGDRERSPRLSRVRVEYEPVAPPPPPPRLRAVPGNGGVELEWAPVRVRGVKGYRVYYGRAPGQYFGDGGSEGSSPIDAGNARSVRIEGLENGVLYFFAVESYDRFGNRSVGELSREVSARPMAWRELNDP
ncbi:MAG: LamG-like jellyroll fold domain-containing protein [Alkalispirochaetaceae bacterium]